MSKPTFENLYTTSSWDYSLIGPEGLALAARLKASGAICSGGVDEWDLHCQLSREKRKKSHYSVDYSSIPAADFNVFPEYTECRPEVPYQDVICSSCSLTVTSSIQRVSRVIATSSPTVYPAKSVTQSLFRAYYSGCRARTVNTTGIYVEDTCTLSKRWQNYGLMLQAPDDIPVCSTGTSSICIHNYYNSLWEWVTGTDGTPGRALMKISVFRNRYADTAALSFFLECGAANTVNGMISLYQIMSHKRSVLLTQIWAYRCQNGRMQVLYLAQVTYHLAHNSDTYYLGLVTGTLTVESLANLTFSFFAFSYSFINLLKARSGMQKLDRHFRLTWEIMQVLITTGVASVLYSSYLTSLPWIVDYNGKLLRKTTVEGAKYCGLHDSCIVMRLNLAIMAVIASTLLGLVALSASYIVQKHSSPWITLGSHVMSFNAPKTALEKVSRGQTPHIAVMPRARFVLLGKQGEWAPIRIYQTFHGLRRFRLRDLHEPTMYECGGASAHGVFVLWQACVPGTVRSVTAIGSTVSTEILTNFQHPSTALVGAPRAWYTHHALSCTWYTASEENYWISEATPIS
ncbi:hypothetical protein GQ600_13904 [Phytophthora cactorum]|nr:hypothetical protein GQ600_13904 [Phytophthora cactorum]